MSPSWESLAIAIPRIVKEKEAFETKFEELVQAKVDSLKRIQADLSLEGSDFSFVVPDSAQVFICFLIFFSFFLYLF